VLRVLDCSVAVDRLEKKHLLKRTPHHTDRRAFLIELTPEGEACFKEHHEFHLKMTRKIVSGLTASELKTFADVIEKILKKI
jgi:DNA-binding MarR family transcriptional regulator